MACAECYEEYLWIVVCGFILSFLVAYGIGANDVANAFASSVGSKALKLWQAVVIAAIFEFLGAFIAGSNVTDTVRKKVTNLDPFTTDNRPDILMYGFLCSLAVVAVWLVLASYLELPVSTTHSIIGAMMGFGLVYAGGNGVVWGERQDDFPYVNGVGAIVLSWIFSPVLSGIFAALLFFLTRLLILRSPNSFNRAFIFFPILVGITVTVNAYFMMYKGIKRKINGQKLSDLGTGTISGIAWGIGVVAGLIMAAIGFFYLKPKVKRDMANRAAAEANPKVVEKTAAGNGTVRNLVTSGVNVDVHAVIGESERVGAVHEYTENFDPATEEAFKYLQVFTAIFDSFSHGANDVANSIAPAASIYAIYRTSTIEKKSDVPLWILALGGAGIVVGLSTYGYNIIRAIGVKLTKITPSRGFCIELGAAIVIIIGSVYGIPLSTTHCQVGATVGVGLIEGTGGVNWGLFLKVAAGWVITLAVAGLSTAALFSQGVYAPTVQPFPPGATTRDGVPLGPTV